MKWSFAVSLFVASVGVAGIASAQAPPSAVSTQSSGPAVNWWYVGFEGGAGAVQTTTGLAGAEAGVRVWNNLDVIVEGGWVGNLATRRESDKASTVASAISSAAGQPASSSITVPTLYAAIGARWVFENKGRFRPYVLLTVGGASVNLKPTFTVGGSNVTSSVSQYGVTLGEDLQGKYRPSAQGGGVGVVVPWKAWYLDASARVLSVNTIGQRTNLVRLQFGFGRRF